MVEWQEVRHVGVRWTLRQFPEYVQQVVVRFDTAGTARQRETVNRGAGLCAVDRVAEQPRLSRSGERPDVPLADIVYCGSPVSDVTAQILPLVARISAIPAYSI